MNICAKVFVIYVNRKLFGFACIMYGLWNEAMVEFTLIIYMGLVIARYDSGLSDIQLIYLYTILSNTTTKHFGTLPNYLLIFSNGLLSIYVIGLATV